MEQGASHVFKGKVSSDIVMTLPTIFYCRNGYEVPFIPCGLEEFIAKFPGQRKVFNVFIIRLNDRLNDRLSNRLISRRDSYLFS